VLCVCVCVCASGVFAAAAERYYKVAAEGLRVCERLVRVLREDVGQTVDSDMVPVAKVRTRGVGGGRRRAARRGIYLETFLGGPCVSPQRCNP